MYRLQTAGRVLTWSVMVVTSACGGKVSGGGGGSEPNRWFLCSGQVNGPDGPVLTLPPPAPAAQLDVCEPANTVEPTDACNTKCEAARDSYLSIINNGLAVNQQVTDLKQLSCHVTDAQFDLTNPGDCPSIDPAARRASLVSAVAPADALFHGGPSQYAATLSGNMHIRVSDSVLGISDSVSADSGISARLAYTISPIDRNCPPEGCQLVISALLAQVNDFVVPGLEILGVTFVSDTPVSGMSLQSVGWITGTWQPNGRFTIAPGAGTLEVTANEDGTHTSFHRSNATPITGTIDPVSGSVVFDAFAQDEDDTTITVGLAGSNVGSPPNAAIALPSTIECNRTRAAAVTLDARASTDPDNDLAFSLWRVNGGSDLFGTVAPATLAFGPNEVVLHEFDARFGVGVADRTITVVDTTPPVFQPLASVTDTLCDPNSQAATIAVPIASDICSPTVTVTGAVISSNGSTLSSPIPVQNGSVRLPAGSHVIRWVATDESGNTTTTTQSLSVRPALEASDAIAIDDRAIVRVQGGGFAMLGNTGHGQTNIGVQSQTGTILSQGNVFLRDRSTVNGNLQTASTVTRQNLTTVTGAISQLAPVALPAGRDLSGIVFPAGDAGPIDLEPGTSRSLAPGAYGAVAVKSRSGLTLTSGTYFFDSLDLEPQSRLNLDQASGPVRLFVRTSVIDRGQIASIAGAPGGFVLGYAGTAGLVIETPFLAGTLIAPNAAVTIASLGAAAFTGELSARDIEVRPDATLTCDLTGHPGQQAGSQMLAAAAAPLPPERDPLSSADRGEGCSATSRPGDARGLFWLLLLAIAGVRCWVRRSRVPAARN